MFIQLMQRRHLFSDNASLFTHYYVVSFIARISSVFWESPPSYSVRTSERIWISFIHDTEKLLKSYIHKPTLHKLTHSTKSVFLFTNKSLSFIQITSHLSESDCRTLNFVAYLQHFMWTFCSNNSLIAFNLRLLYTTAAVNVSNCFILSVSV